MAAAVENSTSNQRYYCHQCNQNISPTIPEYTCPECHLGFIEELNNDNEIDLDESNNRTDGPENQFAFMVRTLEQGRNDIRPGRQTRRRRVHMRRQDPMMSHFAALDQFLRLLGQEGHSAAMASGDQPFGGSPFLNLLHIHGNPGDYAWGGTGLDSIITRLLDQMEGSGPPPADARQIESLPTVKISQDDVDANLECPVCKDVFKVDEEVKKLPCKHYFHEDCIKPWLQKHDSCPICRLGLNGKDNTESESNDN